MALAQRQERVGAGRLYLDVSPPATGSPLALTAGVPSDGIEVGLTEGAAVFTLSTEYVEEFADVGLATAAPIAAFARSIGATLEFTMKEYAATQLEAAMGQATLVQEEGATKYDLFMFGNDPLLPMTVTPRSITLVSPVPNTSPQCYTVAMLYRAYQSAPVVAEYAKGSSTLIRVTFRALADTGRGAHDMMGQLVKYRNE